MSEAYLPAGLQTCLAIVAELRAAAVDPLSDLPMMERRALATLASEVEARAGRRAGVKVDGASAQAVVAEALAAFDEARRKARSSSGGSG